MIKKVIKRDGAVVDFNAAKIYQAIEKAFIEGKQEYSEETLNQIVTKVEDSCAKIAKNDIIGVEEIQNSVEEILKEGNYPYIGQLYSNYRKQREKIRNLKSHSINYEKLISDYININDWRVKENSTVTYSLGGLILSNSGAVTANYWLSNIYDEEIGNAHRNADIHIHDLSMLSGYCAGWSLKQLIKEGLGGVNGKITSSPASHLSTLCNQMVNFLGIMQNEWAGAQAFSSFDTYLAPFVKVDNLSYKEVKQCIQSFVYGVNTPSRWGCVDTDTEVLSTTGWKKYNELKEKDLIYTWKDGELQVNEVRKVIVKPYKGKMHSYIRKEYNQTVTPNHRVLVKKNNDEYEIKLSEEIFDLKNPKALPTMFKGSAAKGIKLSNAEIQLAAILYTDGNIDIRDGKVHKVKIFKSKNRFGIGLIESLLNELDLTYTKEVKKGGFNSEVVCYTMYGDSARKAAELIDSNKKSISPTFMEMNFEQANLFIETWSRFDGNYNKMKLQYDNEQIGDQLQQICLLAGYTSYHTSRNKTNYIKCRKFKNVVPSERKEIDYDGYVWCPNVENGTAVFRKDGNVYISGQTQAPFTNITLDWTVPADLAELNCIVGGKEVNFKYKDCKKEMDMINKAFIEIMTEGDANGRGFQYPIPTYSITKDFDWSDTENNRLLFEMTAKYGTPYFSNYINSDIEPSDVRSMCCRLRLNLRELRKKSGGFFGSGESTGSVGVVTINIPRIAYLSKNENEFYDRLSKMMDIAARSLHIKRKVVTELLENGLYPYTKRYLGTFNNHFSTIGLVGMNETCLNAKWIGKDLSHKEAQDFTKNVLSFMREKLSDYQELYGDLYNLEATPAESTSYRLAKHDKEQFPNIITSVGLENDTPYYTNSSHLPVSYTASVFEALDIQDELQTLYTGGTVFHAFLGEKLPNWESTANLVRKIAENYKLPYYTMSPTYSVCTEHGYIIGEHYKCPKCGKPTEVYSRITGYYRPVQNWNDGKLAEFKNRKLYENFELTKNKKEDVEKIEDSKKATTFSGKPLLFTTPTCPNCPIAKSELDYAGIEYEAINANENIDLVEQYGIMQAPTLVVFENGNIQKYVGVGRIKKYLDNI